MPFEIKKKSKDDLFLREFQTFTSEEKNYQTVKILMLFISQSYNLLYMLNCCFCFNIYQDADSLSQM
jgi:hypothetical protein